MAHTYYEPTEYEQMLIAAGWVDAGSLDTEYLEYRNRFAYPELEDAFMTYEQWVATRKEWDVLNAEYERVYQNMPEPEYRKVAREADELVDAMSEIEILLGY